VSPTEKRARRAALLAEARGILESAARAGADDLTHNQTLRFDAILEEADHLVEFGDSLGTNVQYENRAAAPRQATLDKLETEMRTPRPKPVSGYPMPGGGVWTPEAAPLRPGEVRLLAPTDKLSALFRSDFAPGELRFDRWVKGVVTGDWRGAEAEARAMSVGTQSAGGYIVPAPLALEILDRARNATRVLQAGGRVVPMTSSTLDMGRLSGDPTASWKSELAAFTASDATLERVTFTARVLGCLVTSSVELIEDGQGIEDTLRDSIAASLAVELDRAALRGSGTAPEPRGLRNQSGVTITSLATNGAQLTSYDKFSEAVQNIRTANFEPNAVLAHPRTFGTLDRLKDTTNQPLLAPESYRDLTKLPTAQVPINLTHGTATNASEAYLGRWDELMVGMRTELVVEVSRDASTSSHNFAHMAVHIRAYLRADVQLAHPAAFEVLTGIIP
jgi:HK97 family phage major capsid protein